MAGWPGDSAAGSLGGWVAGWVAAWLRAYKPQKLAIGTHKFTHTPTHKTCLDNVVGVRFTEACALQKRAHLCVCVCECVTVPFTTPTDKTDNNNDDNDDNNHPDFRSRVDE